MADSLELAVFALRPTFPSERVPQACAEFVRDCVPGLTRRQLLTRTRPRLDADLETPGASDAERP
ncbi:hypothetical protein [Burkholderia gladioli]|uniref:Uncharacterized protein n=1 Tax=Burkholderia gladioli (strain BSR3) TaxID=999541 RepID=F2LSB4_BURGS|nr:hypothetical protein [Burkholderia gladioli]AEA65710.1 hypothetical protein bgla_3p0080 [Burkholderia gladioli BSR3]